MGRKIRHKCPNGCGVGLIVRDGRDVCVECGAKAVDTYQSGIDDFA